MKLKVTTIDLEIPHRTKRLALMLGIPVLVIGGSAIAIASVPNAFKDGDVLSADKMNQNFSDLDGRILALEQAKPPTPVITANNKTIAPVGVYCGKTVPTKGKFITATKQGHEAAKELCESACGSPTAHMCTGHDISISLQIGLAPAVNTWIDSWQFGNAGENPVGSGTIGQVYDYNCGGWTFDQANIGSLLLRGAAFAKSDSGGTHYPVMFTCATSLPVACCDNP